MLSESTRTLPRGMPAQAPRLTTLRAVLTQRLARVGQVVWDALEAQARRRSDRDLLALAERWHATNPKLARELRAHVRGGSSY